MSTTTDVPELTTAPPAGKKAVLLFWAPWHEATTPGGPMDQLLRALATTSQTAADVVFGRVQAEEATALTNKYGVTAVPTFVLVDANGNVANKLEGDQGDVSQVTQAVQNLLQMSTTTTPATTTSSAKDGNALTQRLDRLIRSSNVMLFMKGSPAAPRCGFSRQAVELLQSEKIPFGSFDILSDDQVRQGLKAHSNWPTYPQFYVHGELVGGLDIIKELKEEGSLREQWEIDQVEETLDERLKKLVNKSPVMLFMKGLPSAPKCGFSRQMVEILDSLNISYDTFNILEDDEVRQGLKTFSNWPTYPQLYAKGDLIGGLDICKELLESGELEDVLTC